MENSSPLKVNEANLIFISAFLHLQLPVSTLLFLSAICRLHVSQLNEKFVSWMWENLRLFV